MPELPQEILEVILDHVHDRDTLRSCALVASCFLTRSQQRLFRSMRISRDRPHRPPKQQRQTISSILIAAPHLGLYVRDLTVELSVHEDESAALDVILSAVQNLHGFAVNGQYTDWSNIAGGTARRIVECLKLPSLQQVRWQLLICVPLSVMETLLAVPIVSLDIVHMLRQDSVEPIERNIVPKLRDLSFMRDGGTISRFLLNPRNREYLRALKRMEIRPEEYDEQCTVLEACSATLETLAVVLWTSASPLIRIASLPSVRSVELTIFLVGSPQLPKTLLTIAESLASFPNLTTLSFVFKLHVLQEVRQWTLTPIPVFSVESFAGGFSPLRSVHCRLVLYGAATSTQPIIPSEQTIADFGAAVKRCMPGPCEAGILEITVACPRRSG
ncbi:hypothetical protein C8F01DRAFT_1141362 [Mycena amicta]|nr:hypothetical protein C8F01DRAFT_1141362 [Mycena amicta]